MGSSRRRHRGIARWLTTTVAAALAVASVAPIAAADPGEQDGSTGVDSHAEVDGGAAVDGHTEVDAHEPADEPGVVGDPGGAAADGASPAGSSERTVSSLVQDASGELHVQRVDADDEHAADRLVAQLQMSDEVVAASTRTEFHLAATTVKRSDQWHLDRLYGTGRDAPRHARGQLIAVIDSGVDATHPELVGVVVAGVDLVGATDGRVDSQHHGTAVASLIAANGAGGLGAAAPGAKILPIRIFDRTATTTGDLVAEAILIAVKRGATVINLSLAGGQNDPLVAAAIDHAIAKGVPVVAAAGNVGTSRRMWPAAHPDVIGVVASSRADRLLPFSSYGTWVSIAAPGEHLYAAHDGAYKRVQGTSFAAPLVAGTVAMLRAERPELGPQQLHARLRYSAVDLGPRGFDAYFGSGLLAPRAARHRGSSFRDVSPGGTHTRSIAALADTKITRGCNSVHDFCPTDHVTRAQMSSFIARAAQLPPGTTGRFIDTRGDTHEASIGALADFGITVGCHRPQRYCPHENVTRAQMATFLTRALDLPRGSSNRVFTDVHPGSPHGPAIAALQRAGVTEGCGKGRYCPDEPVTREQMATFIARAFGV